MTSASPVVSVLLPVRDGAEHLDEAMASLVSQTLDDFEIVVVDDGSTDDTPEVLGRWLERDARVRLLTQEPTGIVSALERARAGARGRYLARMDADDIAEPRRLEAQLRFLDGNSDFAACGCMVRYFPDDVVRDGARRYEAWLNATVTAEDVARALWVECPLAHPTFFLRAEVIDQIGGYVERAWPEDYDLVLRLNEAGHRMANVPEVLHGWRESPDRLSRTDSRYSAEAFLACKVHYLRRGPLSHGRPVVIWGAGPVGKTLSRALQAAGTEVVAFVDLDPRKIGQEIHGAPVVETAGGVEIRGPMHLAAVGQAGARTRIVRLLEDAGMSPSGDFLTVA